MQPIGPTPGGLSKNGGLKFLIAFLAIVLLGYLTFVIAYNVQHWDEIQKNKQLEKDLEDWADIYRNDNAGGKTPDETIDLFIAALEKNDVELATSYFMPDDYGSRDEERKMMQETFDQGYFPQLIFGLKKAQPDSDGIIGDKFYRFTSFDENGKALGSISMQFNGNVWKVEHF